MHPIITGTAVAAVAVIVIYAAVVAVFTICHSFGLYAGAPA